MPENTGYFGTHVTNQEIFLRIMSFIPFSQLSNMRLVSKPFANALLITTDYWKLKLLGDFSIQLDDDEFRSCLAPSDKDDSPVKWRKIYIKYHELMMGASSYKSINEYNEYTDIRDKIWFIRRRIPLVDTSILLAEVPALMHVQESNIASVLLKESKPEIQNRPKWKKRQQAIQARFSEIPAEITRPKERIMKYSFEMAVKKHLEVVAENVVEINKQHDALHDYKAIEAEPKKRERAAAEAKEKNKEPPKYPAPVRELPAKKPSLFEVCLLKDAEFKTGLLHWAAFCEQELPDKVISSIDQHNEYGIPLYNLNFADGQEKFPIHYALESGNVKTIEYIINITRQYYSEITNLTPSCMYVSVARSGNIKALRLLKDFYYPQANNMLAEHTATPNLRDRHLPVVTLHSYNTRIETRIEEPRLLVTPFIEAFNAIQDLDNLENTQEVDAFFNEIPPLNTGTNRNPTLQDKLSEKGNIVINNQNPLFYTALRSGNLNFIKYLINKQVSLHEEELMTAVNHFFSYPEILDLLCSHRPEHLTAMVMRCLLENTLSSLSDESIEKKEKNEAIANEVLGFFDKFQVQIGRFKPFYKDDNNINQGILPEQEPTSRFPEVLFYIKAQHENPFSAPFLRIFRAFLNKVQAITCGSFNLFLGHYIRNQLYTELSSASIVETNSMPRTYCSSYLISLILGAVLNKNHSLKPYIDKVKSALGEKMGQIDKQRKDLPNAFFKLNEGPKRHNNNHAAGRTSLEKKSKKWLKSNSIFEDHIYYTHDIFFLYELYEETNIFKSAALGKTAELQNALQANTGLLNTTLPDGASLLYLATKYQRSETVDFLLAQNGIKLNQACLLWQHTPLHRAVLNKDFSLVQKLISKGADVNAKLQQGESPLYLAYKLGEENIIAALVNAGANINIADTSDKAPCFLTTAIKRMDLKLISRLLKEGASVSKRASQTFSPVRLAFSFFYSFYLNDKIPHSSQRLLNLTDNSQLNILVEILSYHSWHTPVEDKKTILDLFKEIVLPPNAHAAFSSILKHYGFESNNQDSIGDVPNRKQSLITVFCTYGNMVYSMVYNKLTLLNIMNVTEDSFIERFKYITDNSLNPDESIAIHPELLGILSDLVIPKSMSAPFGFIEADNNLDNHFLPTSSSAASSSFSGPSTLFGANINYKNTQQLRELYQAGRLDQDNDDEDLPGDAMALDQKNKRSRDANDEKQTSNTKVARLDSVSSSPASSSFSAPSAALHRENNTQNNTRTHAQEHENEELITSAREVSRKN